MGMHSLVAKSNEEYIELVHELIQNQEKFQQIQSQLKQAKHILFNDLEPIRAFEQFLLTECRENKFIKT
jgi:predicted O-linked N-acetylglucosamine transferase (SPINDLY family)